MKIVVASQHKKDNEKNVCQDLLTIENTDSDHRGPAQSVWVADCYFIVNVLDLPFASPIVVNRQLCT